MKRFFLALLLIASPAFATDRALLNPEANGDLKIKAYNGTTTTDAITVTGSTANTTFGGARIVVPNGTSTVPAIGFTADTTTGFSRSNANTLDFITGGINRLVIDDAYTFTVVASTGNATTAGKLTIGTNGSSQLEPTIVGVATGSSNIPLRMIGKVIDADDGSTSTPAVILRGQRTGGGALTTRNLLSVQNVGTEVIGVAPNGLTTWVTGGIKLPSSGGTASTLNYYEERTWTPTITFSTSGTGTISPNTVTSTRIGRQTIIDMDVTITKSTGVGNVTIGGLPQTSAIDSYCNRISTISGTPVSGLSAGQAPVAHISGTTMGLEIQSLDTTSRGNFTNTNLPTTWRVSIHCDYIN